MDSLLIILVGILIGISLAILYFQLKSKPKQEENSVVQIQQEIIFNMEVPHSNRGPEVGLVHICKILEYMKDLKNILEQQ